MSARIAVNLLGQRRYLPLLAAQALGAFNDNFFRYALVTLVAYHGLTVFELPRDILVPVAASLFTLPIFLFSAMAGRVADVFDRTRVLRFTKFAEIWLMLLAATGFIFDQPHILLGTLFFMGVQSAFFAPAKNAALPTLLESHELVPGNAMISGTLNMAVLLGIGFGTVLIGGENGSLIVGGVLVAVAITGWLSMRALPPAPAATPGLKVSYNIVAETIRVAGYALKAPDVLRPLLGAAWFWMLAASIVTMMPVFAASVLGADATVVLLFSALFTVGAAVGAILCGVLSGKGDALPFTIAGAIGLVVFPTDVAFYTMGFALTPEGADLVNASTFITDRANWRILADLGLAAISAGLFVVPLQAMAQRRAPAALRGRLLSAGGILNAATATLGQFTLAGIALMGLPLQSAFLFIAVISGFAAIFTFIRWRRGRAMAGAA
tara:strand:- start:1581 stop:2894 length:1314 start_codon:yes stop_codon:yes gene_type:complete